MIYFVLPDFFQKYPINNYLRKQAKQNSKMFKEEITFSYQHGSFPYTTWNGNINSNFGYGVFYQELLNFLSLTNNPIRLDFSNILLEDYDFDNTFCNLILSYYQIGSTQIELSNLDLLEYIDKNYDNYSYVFSNNAFLMAPLNADIINMLFENIEKLSYLILDPKENKNEDLLSNIEHLEKIEIIVNNICPYSCSKYNQCPIAENKAQINYSLNSCFKECKNTLNPFDNNSFISLEEIKEFYLPKNINHFVLRDMPSLDLHEYLLFVTEYFIKEEFKLLFIENYYNYNKQ